MSELTSDHDEETVTIASATISFSSRALLFGLKRKGVVLCAFKATRSIVNTGLTPLVFVSLKRGSGVTQGEVLRSRWL